VAGCCLLALGIAGDANAWWSDAPFLTNVLSSVAGAMFGIPIALLILPLLADDLAKHSERRAVTNLATAIVESLSSTFAAVVEDPDAHLGRLMDLIRQVEGRVPGALFEFLDLWPRVFKNDPEGVAWAALAAEWEGLRSLRTRLRESNCPWLEPQAVHTMTSALTFLTSPDGTICATTVLQLRASDDPWSGLTIQVGDGEVHSGPVAIASAAGAYITAAGLVHACINELKQQFPARPAAAG